MWLEPGPIGGKPKPCSPWGPEKRPNFLASRQNPAIYRAISHGNMAQKAVRWQPGHKARLLTRFRRNQPENFYYGASRFLYASAARSWRSLWPPIAPLESEDGGLHFRCPQQHPHHRPRPDRAAVASRAAGG